MRDMEEKWEITMPVEVKIKITPWSTWQLQKIFRHSFDIQILLKCDRNFSKIFLETQVVAGPPPVHFNSELEVIQI